MKISEKQIMQLITIARTLAYNLNDTGNMIDTVKGQQVLMFLDRITNQQSEELKEISDD